MNGIEAGDWCKTARSGQGRHWRSVWVVREPLSICSRVGWSPTILECDCDRFDNHRQRLDLRSVDLVRRWRWLRCWLGVAAEPGAQPPKR